MIMIDTHAHLNFPELLVNLEKIVDKSKKKGLTAIIVASSNLKDSKKAIELAKNHPSFLYASVGIHPQKTDPENQSLIKDQIKILNFLIKDNPQQVVAIGEVGLDFGSVPPDEEERNRKDQEELFNYQIELAIKYNLPLIIHAREANDQVIEILQTKTLNLKSKTRLHGVFHCYSGGKKRIQRILDLSGDWYFGIDGNITYDQGLVNVVGLIPKNKLLLETDSPFLSPEPKRGEINTPANLPLIVQKVAEIWQVDKQEVVDQTLENTKKLFSLK